MTYINCHAIKKNYPTAEWVMVDDAYEGLTWMSDDIPKPTLEELVAATQAFDTELAWDRLREERDSRLAKTDWMVLSDTTEATAEQLAYRQALRDLPANTEDPLNPVWPTKP